MSWLYLIRPTRLGMIDQETEAEAATLSEHFEYLSRLRDEGLLVLAGPSIAGADTFGIVILDTEDEETARSVMNDDPAIRSEVMSGELRAFRISLASGTLRP